MAEAKKSTTTTNSSGEIKQVMAFFDMKAGEFMKEWKPLPDKDRAQLREGVMNGTLTY